MFAGSAAASAGAAAAIVTPGRHAGPARRLVVAGAVDRGSGRRGNEERARPACRRPTARATRAATRDSRPSLTRRGRSDRRARADGAAPRRSPAARSSSPARCSSAGRSSGPASSRPRTPARPSSPSGARDQHVGFSEWTPHLRADRAKRARGWPAERALADRARARRPRRERLGPARRRGAARDPARRPAGRRHDAHTDAGHGCGARARATCSARRSSAPATLRVYRNVAPTTVTAGSRT